MPYLQQQQQPGPFGFLDGLMQKIPTFSGYITGGMGGVGGYYYGLEHPALPLMAYIIGGMLIGFLAAELLKHLTEFVIIAALAIVAAAGSYWLLGNETTLRQHHAAPATQAAPASPAKAAPQSLLNDLRKAGGL